MASPGVTAGVRAHGVAEFRKQLKELDHEWPKELRKANKEVASIARDAGRERARSWGGIRSKAATAIASSATQTAAKLAINTGTHKYANVAFFGAKRRTGWYAARRYANSTRQHDPWVGNAWDVGVAGQGPYAINEALSVAMPSILSEYVRMLDELFQEAFPGPLGSAGAVAAF